jgi:acyl carrier protein
LNITHTVLHVLDESLSLHGRSKFFTRETPLLGSLPELDSMAVITLITMLEEHFEWTIYDDEIDGATFKTVGTLIDFVCNKQPV